VEELIPIIAILMVFGLPMLFIWTKHREKMVGRQLDAAASNTAEKAAQYASHVQELEDRVRVLERIVTDGGYDVATQIEALRDQRRVENQQGEADKAVN
jgi:F0F1-type ATP synthase membrane subunit b/b'